MTSSKESQTNQITSADDAVQGTILSREERKSCFCMHSICNIYGCFPLQLMSVNHKAKRLQSLSVLFICLFWTASSTEYFLFLFFVLCSVFFGLTAVPSVSFPVELWLSENFALNGSHIEATALHLGLYVGSLCNYWTWFWTSSFSSSQGPLCSVLHLIYSLRFPHPVAESFELHKTIKSHDPNLDNLNPFSFWEAKPSDLFFNISKPVNRNFLLAKFWMPGAWKNYALVIIEIYWYMYMCKLIWHLNSPFTRWEKQIIILYLLSWQPSLKSVDFTSLICQQKDQWYHMYASVIACMCRKCMWLIKSFEELVCSPDPLRLTIPPPHPPKKKSSDQ